MGTDAATVDTTSTTQTPAPTAPPSTGAGSEASSQSQTGNQAQGSPQSGSSGSGTSSEQQSSQGSPDTNVASTSATETKASPEWWATIDSIDPKELLKHPKLAGTLGDLAQRRAQEERRKWDADQQRAEAERRQREETDRLRQLRDNDPALYIEEQKRLEVEHEQRTQAQQQAQQQILGDLHSFFNERFAQLPSEDQQKLAGKNWGEGVTGFRAAMAEIDEILGGHATKAQVEKARVQWEKEARTAIREAVRKEVLAEVNGQEPAADTGGGQSAPGALTVEEFDRNRRDASWRRANKERINTLLASMPVPRR